MQTFLPYADFERSAKVLDYRRLGKQRLEARDILRINLGHGFVAGGGWGGHPAVKMWRGFEGQLARYGYIITVEWRARGYKDQQLDFFEEQLRKLKDSMTKPWWLGWEDFHRSHRANLLRKKPDHYSQFWKEDTSLPYLWPTKEDSHGVDTIQEQGRRRALRRMQGHRR